ncbi:hypothetical protein QAD02_003872 [Eretmocerus hayati]|uniref:Uncharacterized protein n=1 Tax=Eretmocerus hayati TaxID=131215 RepID=A0ACC2NP13_9HYME|nr:hypothetical protein QAD02_003872 [Eretmocerus hayati]
MVGLNFLLKIYPLILISVSATPDCYNNDDQLLNCNFATKTPYRYVANHNVSRPVYPGCTERKIWMIIRHGTRYPSKKWVKKMTGDLPELQDRIEKEFKERNSELSREVADNLRTWRLPFSKNEKGKMTDEGKDELFNLAKRMQARFPTLFRTDNRELTYKFKHTDTDRTEDSAKAFTRGLLGEGDSSNIMFLKTLKKDPILTFYEKCPRWLAYEKDPESSKESELFEQSQFVRNVASNVSKRIGFRIDSDEAKLMYMMCAHETALNKTMDSPWCALFTLNDVKTLEFLKELKTYWQDGYGNELNYKQSCPALRDMFQYFESYDGPTATTYFSHSGALLKLLPILGIAKDEKLLTHESFSLQKGSRKWKTTLLCPFASNLAFVLYDCAKQGSSVLLLHQERAVKLPGCPSDAPCPMQIVKDNLPDTERECEFDKMCSVKKES